jgi:hypothetical protein
MELAILILVYVLIALLMIGVFVLSWGGSFPKFFPKTIKKMMIRDVPTYYDEQGKIFSFPNVVQESSSVSQTLLFASPSTPIEKPAPRLDFNSPTTATINIEPKKDVPESNTLSDDKSRIQENKLEDMSLNGIKVHCHSCKQNINVINPVYKSTDSMKGTRRTVRGSCSICNNAVYGIVKNII